MGNLAQIVTDLEERRSNLQKELQGAAAAIDALRGLAPGWSANLP